MKLREVVVFFLVLLAMSGCTYRYAPMPDRDFDGIVAEGANAHIVRIFVIHGMGDHFAGYSDDLVRTLADRAGLVPAGAAEHRGIRYMGGPVHAADLRVLRLAKPGSTAQFRVYELTWSPLTIPIKDKHLNGDREPAYSWHRASINKALKEGLIDRAFSDAILYVGDFGEAMRWTVTQGICHMLNDRHSGDGICDMRGTDIPDLDADQIVLVSSSLGSRMLLDTLVALLGDAESQPVIDQAFAKTNLVFMLANQVSLLGLSNVREPEGLAMPGAAAIGAGGMREKSFAAFVRNWSLIQQERAKVLQLPKDAARRPLRVIAFSDPNDLLSFRLLPDDVSGRKDVELINVIVSNAPEIFGVVARPDKAHTGYAENAGVLNLMVCGSKGLNPACH